MQRHDSRGSRRRDRDRPARRGGRASRPSPEERLSRLLAYVLRHHPEEFGLEMDDRGAVRLDALLEALRRRPGFEDLTRQRVEALVANGPGAGRFAIEGDTLRARYGHSLARPIAYEPADPPPFLFHGTTPAAAEEILAEGLTAGQRQRVHLSVDTPAARAVGRRHCPDPVILQIDTACASKGGVRFYRGSPTVWLADDIPPQCITRMA